METTQISVVSVRRLAEIGVLLALLAALPSAVARAQADDEAARLEAELFGDEPPAPRPEPRPDEAEEEPAPELLPSQEPEPVTAEEETRPGSGGFLDEEEFTTSAQDEPQEEVKFEFDYTAPPADDTEEIIIRGEKRESSAQSQAVAITEFDQSSLDEFGVQDIEGLQDFVPSLHIGQVGNLAIITLRGVGLENITIVGEPSVIFEQDGVPIGRPSAALAAAFFDLENLEVVRGPQGTRGGRQSTGGKIALYSKRPGPEFEFFGDFQYGTRNQKLSRAAVNVPIIEELLMSRFSIFHEDRDGYQKNEFFITEEQAARVRARPPKLVSGTLVPNRFRTVQARDLSTRDRWADDAENLALRFQLMSLPTDDIEARVIFSYSQQGGVGPGPFLLNDFDQACPDDTKPSDVCPLDLLGPTGEQTKAFDPRNTLIDQIQFRDNFQVGLTAGLTWDLPTLPLLGDVRVKGIGGWQKNKQQLFIDFDASNADFVNIFVNNLSTQRSFEAYAESVEAEELEWKFGFFFFREDNGGETNVRVSFASVDDFIEDEVVSESIAGYGELAYWLTDTLRLGGGIRYTQESKLGVNFTPDIAVIAFPRLTFTDWTPSAEIQWQVTDTSSLNASVTKGFKAGGFDLGAGPLNTFRKIGTPQGPNGLIFTTADALAEIQYDPESVWQYQVTSKNQLLDDTLQLNVTAFWTSYEEYQSCQINSTALECKTDGKAQIRGIEVEGIWEPIGGLRINSNVDFLDTKLDEFLIEDPVLEGGQAAASGILTDLRGNQLPRSPRFKVTAGLQYEIELGSYGFLTPRVGYTWQDRTYFRTFNRKPFSQKPFHKVDVKLTWRSTDERFTIEAGVDNVTGVDIINNLLIGPLIADSPVLAFYRPPRTWSIKVGWRWQ